MTIESPNNMPYIPNSGCSTFEVNQKMMDDTYAALKKVDETVDKFIKTEEGKAKKESLQKKLKAIFLIGLADAMIAFALLKSGKINKLTDTIMELSTKKIKLNDIKFDKGKALLKNGKEFTGIISDKLPNGDKIKMIYENGILQKTARKGSTEFVKEFSYEDGSSVLKKITTKGKDGKFIKVSEFKNGKIHGTESADSAKLWGDNGLLKYSVDKKTGTTKLWHENGQLANEANGFNQKSWHENGQLWKEWTSDGVFREYYEDGKLAMEVMPDKTRKAWLPNGRLYTETLADGTINNYDATGNII